MPKSTTWFIILSEICTGQPSYVNQPGTQSKTKNLIHIYTYNSFQTTQDKKTIKDDQTTDKDNDGMTVKPRATTQVIVNTHTHTVLKATGSPKVIKTSQQQ